MDSTSKVGDADLSRTPDLYGSRELTEKEVQVAKLVTEGKTNAEIGRMLGNSPDMIKQILKRVFDKAGVWSRLELALWILRREKE